MTPFGESWGITSFFHAHAWRGCGQHRRSSLPIPMRHRSLAQKGKLTQPGPLARHSFAQESFAQSQS